jgi:cyclase
VTTSAADHPELPPPRTEEVADGVFAYLQPDGGWFINNTGFVAGRRTVLAVDSCATERRTAAFLAAVDERAGRRPEVLVNTHHHGDHTNGNSLLPGAAVVGHRRCREEMVQAGILTYDGLFDPVEWGTLAPAPPFITFEHRLDLWVDDTLVELHHPPTAAHTTNDVVAWLPASRVLFAGDLLFNGGTPFAVMGSIAGSLEALDWLSGFGAEVIIPGHGPLAGPDVLARCGEYLRSVQQHAESTSAAGLTPLEAARSFDLAPYADLAEPERLGGNLHRAFAECRGARPGDAIDLVAAFADMVTLNGGRPLRCRA